MRYRVRLSDGAKLELRGTESRFVTAPWELRTIRVGDSVIVLPGDGHWHGAGDTGSPMSHLAITRRDSLTELTED